MKHNLFGGAVTLALVFATQCGIAADLPVKASPPPALAWSWAGWYIGAHSGAMWSGSKFSDPFGPSIFGDLVAVPGYLAGAQIGYNWQGGNIVFGLEADGSLVSSDGSNTCVQFSGLFVGSNCRAKVKDLASFTGRLGVATGPAGRTLVYAKGGAAWIRNEVSINPNNEFFGATTPVIPQPPPTALHYDRWGWTAGAGVEHAMTPAWSLKAEYDYYRFGDETIATPPGFIVTATAPSATVFLVPARTSNISQDAHVLKIGANYKLGTDPWARWDNAPGNVYLKAAPRSWAPGWEVDLGARYWYSSGKFQWDNFAASNILESRLTYDKLTAHSGEFFGRIDSPWNFFAKGVIGGGRITGGHLNDEDWGLPPAIAGVFTSYSNTLSEPVKGPMRYANFDLGYDLTRGLDYKAGPFIGYHYNREVMNAYGCTQTVSTALICVPSFGPGVLAITETAKWQALRLGFAGEVMLWDRVRLNGEVAYLPWVRFDGHDQHPLRPGVFFDQSSDSGHGVQTEVLLSYLVTNQFSIGLGGRYWAMWTDGGTFTCTGCGDPGVTTAPFPSKNNTERFGTFVQGSYRW
jgi:opacity protein-like surface antigen/outer membrane protease